MWRALRSLIRPLVLDSIWRIGVFMAAMVILIVIATRWTRWEGNAKWQTTDDAYLQADLTPIAAKVAGYVRSLPVQDFDRVHAGDVLAQTCSAVCAGPLKPRMRTPRPKRRSLWHMISSSRAH